MFYKKYTQEKKSIQGVCVCGVGGGGGGSLLFHHVITQEAQKE